MLQENISNRFVDFVSARPPVVIKRDVREMKVEEAGELPLLYIHFDNLDRTRLIAGINAEKVVSFLKEFLPENDAMFTSYFETAMDIVEGALEQSILETMQHVRVVN